MLMDTYTAPAEDGLEWKRVTLETQINGQSPFTGQPRPEVEDSWNDLLQSTFTFLRV